MAYLNPTIPDFKTYFTRDFPYNADPAEGVTDGDIGKAYGQVDVNFNPALAKDQATYTILFLLLAAHWLVVDLRMASQGVSSQYAWLVTSKSVGSVSESFQIPERIAANPELAMLTQTGYGAKFLQLILPQLAGQVFIAYGRTLA